MAALRRGSLFLVLEKVGGCPREIRAGEVSAGLCDLPPARVRHAQVDLVAYRLVGGDIRLLDDDSRQPSTHLTLSALNCEPVFASCAERIASSPAEISCGVIEAEPTIILETVDRVRGAGGRRRRGSGRGPVLAVPPHPATRKTHTQVSIDTVKRMAAFLTQSPRYAIHGL